MIAGQSPKMTWEPNMGGQRRTIEQAMEIARSWGVTIREDVVFFEDEENELVPENNNGDPITARGPRVGKWAGTIVRWSDLLSPLTRKVPFIIRRDILDSDEAIVAVFGHEMYELEKLRVILPKGKTTIELFNGHTMADNPGNLHDEAWDHADELVERMRQARKKGGV